MQRIAIAACAALGALFALAPASSADSTSSVSTLARVAIDSEPDFSNLAQTGERHSYVILQVSRRSEAEAIKAANPEVKVLAYKNLSAASSSTGPGGMISSGVSEAEANSSHPEWFLNNSDGQRFTFSGYSYLWAMNIANAGYQSRWAASVIDDLRDGPWVGP